MEEATAAAIDADGFLHSGDLAASTRWLLSGNRPYQDMIIRGGENIYPLEIENFLLKMPGVLDAQVVGAPDERLGEIVVAFIRQRPGFELTEQGVRDYTVKQMARFKVPKYVFFVDEFPETASKKVQKYKLRETAAELVKERKAQEAASKGIASN